MKKKRGFTLKSGNNIGAKGRKPSNFKMMGASPAKAMGRFTTDDEGRPVQISDIEQKNIEREQDEALEKTFEIPRQYSEYNPSKMDADAFEASDEGKKIIDRLTAEAEYKKFVPGTTTERIYTSGQEKIDELVKQYSGNERLKRTGNMKGLLNEAFLRSLPKEDAAEIQKAYRERDEEKKSGVAAEQAKLDAEARKTDPAYLARQKKRGFQMKRKK